VGGGVSGRPWGASWPVGREEGGALPVNLNESGGWGQEACVENPKKREPYMPRLPTRAKNSEVGGKRSGGGCKGIRTGNGRQTQKKHAGAKAEPAKDRRPQAERGHP